MIEVPDHPCESRSYQVIGERPEIALYPDSVERLALGKRDYGCDAAGVGDEIGDGGDAQKDRAVMNPVQR